MTTTHSGAVVADAMDRRLRTAGIVFAVGSLIHLLDHLRRGQGSVTEGLYWAGNLALILQVVIITLILTHHRLAPLVAAVGGLTLGIGFLAAHWLPEWSDLSDPVWEIHSWSALSYAASALEIIGALAVGVCGLAIVRRDGLASYGTTEARSAHVS